MSEHAIPQDILSYEFKLFAGLTWKQFVYVGIGVASGVLLIQGSVKGIIPKLIGFPFGILLIIIPLLLALMRFQNRPMEDWIMDVIRIYNMPLLRAWLKNKKSISIKNALISKPKLFPEYTVALLEVDSNQSTGIQTTIKETYFDKISNTTSPTIINLTLDNATQYSVSNVKMPQIPNTIAFLIQKEKPITNVTATLSDSSGNIIKALKSNSQGIIYFNETIPNGIYHIKFIHNSYSFPEIQVEMNGGTFPLIKITPI